MRTRRRCWSTACVVQLERIGAGEKWSSSGGSGLAGEDWREPRDRASRGGTRLGASAGRTERRRAATAMMARIASEVVQQTIPTLARQGDQTQLQESKETHFCIRSYMLVFVRVHLRQDSAAANHAVRTLYYECLQRRKVFLDSAAVECSSTADHKLSIYA